jgi:hypothetical protein
MKRNKLVLGSISVAAIAVSAVMISKMNVEENSYATVSLNTSSESQKIDGFNEWWRAHHINSTTGEVMTSEEFQQGQREMRLLAASQTKTDVLDWVEQGPENVGGRTRAIIIDRLNENHVYAASVSGGLFESFDKGNLWHRVESWDAFMFITSMCQTEDGTVFVGTGDSRDFSEYSFVGGKGVWYQSPGQTEWTNIPGTSSRNIGELVAPRVGNTVYFCGPGNGMAKWTKGDTAITPMGSSIGLPSGNCSEVEVSADGQVILGFYGSVTGTYVSKNGGASFTSATGSESAGLIPAASGARFEYSISPTRVNGEYICYAAGTNNYTGGVFRSSDSGTTWARIAAGTNDQNSLVNFYGLGQGRYNSTIKVDPTNFDRLILGGVDLYEWQLATASPVTGGWSQLSLWFAAETSPMYVHADNHDLVFDSSNRMYIGNDGGIGISTDLGNSFIAANRGYNTVQFYSIAHDGSGRLLGGTQDNGTLYNSKRNNSPREFRKAMGGDGFDCAISFYNPKVMFGTVYHGLISRSGDGGQSFNSFTPNYVGYGTPGLGENGQGNQYFPFHTSLFLGEFLDENSKDSVTYLPRGNFSTGDVLNVPSLASGDTIKYTLLTDVYFDDTVRFDPSLTITDYKVTDLTTQSVYTLYDLNYTPFATASGQNPPLIGDSLLVTFGSNTDTIVVSAREAYSRFFATHPITGKVLDLVDAEFEVNVSWDTLRVQDPFQSIFITYTSRNGGELYATRDALRLSSSQPKWSIIAQGIGSMGSVGEIEFSANLEHIYVGTSTGVFRIDGLRDVYSSEADFSTRTDLRNGTAPAITVTKIYNSSVSGLSVNPRDKGHVILSRSGTGGAIVFQSLTADIDGTAVGNGSFTSINGNLSTSVAAYDVLIDRADDDLILVGTDFGLWFTNNGGTTWNYASEGFGEVPVTRIKQNWREGQEGCWRPGEIYISTFGRGMFASESVLSLPNPANYYTGPASHKTSLNIYPNPMHNNGTVAFELSQKADVYIEVYSITGKLMKRFTQSNMPTGKHDVQFGVNELSNGTYILRLKAGDTVETAKFIKQ